MTYIFDETFLGKNAKSGLVDAFLYTVVPPYSTCELGSPGAWKFVSGLPVSFAAEQRAIVGELYALSVFGRGHQTSINLNVPSGNNVSHIKVLNW